MTQHPIPARFEIERKFLVTTLPDLTHSRKSHLQQGYIATGETEVRLRAADERYTLTCKKGNGISRREEEIELTLAHFETLWPLTEDCRIEKTRYTIPFRDYLIELDEYLGTLSPLLLAEIEFESEAASQRIRLPDYFGKEVTDDPRYKNKRLALEGFPQRSLTR